MADISSNLKLQIGHVLFIDIVGYSKLLINQQTELLRKLNTIVSETEQVRATYSRRAPLILPTGDGMALVFHGSPEEPAKCALEIAKKLKKHPELKIRMGIHSGPVNELADVTERTNVAGTGVNFAQRIMNCGDAGHILVSKHVAEDLQDYPQWRPLLHDLGECEVKHGAKVHIFNLHGDGLGNPARPATLLTTTGKPSRRLRGRWLRTTTVVAIALSLAVGWIFLRRTGTKSFAGMEAGTIPENSVAVLPFADLSQARDQEYFCDGISEEILDRLAKIEGLRVVARTSSFAFKNKNIEIGEIAHRLGVATILEGSLRREGNRVRISAQLINAKTGFHLWSDTFERELKSIFAVQDEITRAIVDALKLKLAAGPAQPSPQSTDAYDLYLRGRYLTNKSDEQSLRKALGLFQQALDKDPTLGRAWIGIADVWDLLADEYVKPLEAYPLCRAAALKALELNKSQAEAYVYLAESELALDYDLKGATRDYRHALEIDRNLSVAHEALGELLRIQGEPEEGIKEGREATKLDPLSLYASQTLCNSYIEASRLDEAATEAKRASQIDPNFIYGSPVLASVYRAQGKLDDAMALYLRAEELTRVPSIGLAIAYAKTGRKADAEKKLNELISKASEGYVRADSIASVYVALGRNEEALGWLERAYRERSSSLPDMVASSQLRPLRNDRRFIDLVKRVGLDPAKALR